MSLTNPADDVGHSGERGYTRRMRAILVKHWIDLGRITFHVSTNGVVAMNGALAKLPGTGELTPQSVGEMIGEIENLQHVMRVEAEFDNWLRAGFAGLWTNVDKSKALEKPAGMSDGGPGQTIVINVKDHVKPE